MSYDDNANLQDVRTLHCKHKTEIIDGREILASLVVRGIVYTSQRVTCYMIYFGQVRMKMFEYYIRVYTFTNKSTII